MRRRVLIGIGVLYAFAGGAYYWLFVDNAKPAGSFAIDLAGIRAAAAGFPGKDATSIEVETVSLNRVPRTTIVSGTDWSTIDFPRNVYRVVFPDRTLIIDTGWDAKTAQAGHAYSFDQAAYERVAAAMRSATTIVVTHEHGDHIGGLLTSPDWKTLLPKALITSEQFDHPEDARPVQWPPTSRDTFKPLVYVGYRAIAPGVVLIKAPGHTPGSQIIYVRRSDGQEYLFVGDVASQADNIRLQHGRSRLVDIFWSGSDSGAVRLQLAELNRLSLTDPSIAMVPGHDADAIRKLESAGLMHRGF